MTYKEIVDLIKMVNKYSLSEFKLKEGEFEVTIRSEIYSKGKTDQIQQMPSVISVPTTAVSPSLPEQPIAAVNEAVSGVNSAKEEESAETEYVEIKSPMVGTFYRSSSPDKPAYVKVGDVVGNGSVVCIIEAMKLFNEIESEVSGKIVKILVDDASPVEYEQPLFLVDPKG